MVYLPHWPIPSTLGKKIINYETVFERAQKVLEKLGNPHQHLPPIIHVAGTNGKGSTASLIAKIFQCHGYKAHLYTSPHLHDCNERILLNGEKISDQELYQVMEETRIQAGETDLTFMEGFTIGAFLAFANNPADVAVVECGMGARIDITNIIEKKLASVITSISLDHTEYLGDTIEKIAFEKSFVIRPETPLIVGPQNKKVEQIIKILSDDQKALSYFYDQDFAVEINHENRCFDFYWNDEILLPQLSPPNLAGEHQYHNFACAIATCMALSDKYNFNYNGINQAISSVEWQSRLEKVDNNLNKILANSDSEIWIDGAHNEGGALVLSKWLRAQKNDKINFIICGFSRKKCRVNFLNKFNEIAQIVAVRVNGEPYPQDSEEICSIANSQNIKAINGDNLLDALIKINEISNGRAVRIVICGSLHLARDVKYFSQIAQINLNF